MSGHPSPSRIASKHLRASVWYEDYDYYDLTGAIGQDRYSEYDSLVHWGYTEALRKLSTFLSGRGQERPSDTQAEYEGQFDRAAKIPKASRAVAYARKNGLGQIKAIVALLMKAEGLRQQAQKLLAEAK